MCGLPVTTRTPAELMPLNEFPSMVVPAAGSDRRIPVTVAPVISPFLITGAPESTWMP